MNFKNYPMDIFYISSVNMKFYWIIKNFIKDQKYR